MPCNIYKVISVAREEIGYHEKESWDQLDDKSANAGDGNFVKYSRDLAKYNFYNSSKKGVAWCDIFCDWCMYAAFGPNAAKKLLCQPTRSSGAGCKHSMQYYKNKGRFFESDPQIGDQIFFWAKDAIGDPDKVQHTGLVADVTASRVYVVEGNTTSDEGVVSSGGCVAEKKYKLSFERIAGYGRPDYAGVDPDPGYEDETNRDQSDGDEDTMAKKTATVVADSGSTVNMRKLPDSTSPVIVRVPIGAEVTVNDHTDTWAQIAYGSSVGYMMVKFLAFSEEEVDEVSLLVEQIYALVSELAEKAK